MRILLTFLLSIFSLFAKTDLQVDNRDSIYNDFSFNYMVDENSEFTIGDIIKKEFTLTSSNSFTLGYIKKPVWIKLTIHNRSNFEDFILSLNEGFYEVADLYYFDKEWKKISNSLFKPIEERSVRKKQLSFSLDLKQDTTRTYYLKINGKFAFFGNLVLYEKERFFYENTFNSTTLFLVIVSAIFIVIIFNLFLYFGTGEKIYLYYLLYAFFNIIYLLNINGFLVYLNLQEYLYKIQSLTGLLMVFLILFSLEYFDTKVLYPKIDKIFKFLALSFFITGVMLFLSYEPWNKILNQLVGVVCISLIVLSILVYLKGNRKTKYYTLAMVTYMFFAIIYTFMLSGIFEYSAVTRYGFVVASFCEVIIFSLLLATRYHDMKQEIQKYLEDKVLERTESLVEANNELSSLVEEREVLLREIHHRVKNNFHMIVGLLSLKKSKQESSSEETINRILLMSDIHENLYNSDNIGHINIKNYLEELSNKTLSVYKNSKLQIEVEELNVDFDTALALGIIINELITNAYKHNSEFKTLLIDISLKKEKQLFFLEFKDNGKGFIYTHKNRGLGLKLIKQFSKKLKNSSFDFTNKEGSVFSLTFQLEESSKE